MKPRIIFIHGNGAMHWNFAFSGWLKRELENSGFETFFETFPDSVLARADYWLPFLKNHVVAGKNDLLVGWSSGAVASMRYAQSYKILGSILISPSYTDMGDDTEKQSGYFDKPWDWADIRSNQKKITLIYGDNDPYVPQSEFKFIADKLHPDVIKVAGGKHFIEFDRFPLLLRYIEVNYGSAI